MKDYDDPFKAIAVGFFIGLVIIVAVVWRVLSVIKAIA